MANKLQTTIKIKIKEGKEYKTKQFTSADFLPGSVLEDATDLLERMSESETTDDVKKALSDCYDFIGKVVFEEQFTGKEYRDGIDAREIAPLTGKILRSISQGHDAVYSEQKKK